MRDWVVSGGNADAVVLQSVDGSVVLSLHSDKMVYDGPLFQINADIEHNGNTTHTGNMTHTGNINRTGDTVTVGALTNNGKSVGSDHKHDGVTPGPAVTGEPV